MLGYLGNHFTEVDLQWHYAYVTQTIFRTVYRMYPNMQVDDRISLTRFLFQAPCWQPAPAKAEQLQYDFRCSEQFD